MDIERELLEIFTLPFIRVVERNYKIYCINPTDKNYQKLTNSIKLARNQISEQTNAKFYISTIGKSGELFNLYTQILK